MRTLPRDQADILWDEYWTRTRHEWFKVEVLQDYAAEDDSPSLRSWLRGDKEKSIELMEAEDLSDWIESCGQKLAQGVKLLRYHVVETPYSPYIEWEIEVYKRINVPKCGELVFLVDKAALGGLQLPPGDLMIFDAARAVVNDYDAHGRVTNRTFYDETDYISKFLKLARTLKKTGRQL
jgi:hypothetical protein